MIQKTKLVLLGCYCLNVKCGFILFHKKARGQESLTILTRTINGGLYHGIVSLQAKVNWSTQEPCFAY